MVKVQKRARIRPIFEGVIRDRLNILRSMTPARMVNFIKLVAGYHVSRWTKRPHQWGLPVALSIEPTTSCNLRCPQCPSGLRVFSRPTGMLQKELMSELLPQIRSSVHTINFYFQGEPYLNPDFLEMVKMTLPYNIYTSTSTNAHYLDAASAQATVESGLKRLIISVDGTTQATYGEYRVGGQLEKVLAGTRALVEAKRRSGSATPHLVWQFVVFKPNEHQVDEVKKLGRELGVDEVVIKTAQIYDFENGSDLIPSEGKYARYRKNAEGRFEIKNKLLNQCWRMWQSSVITWDGKMVPCCFDKDAHYRLGDLKKEPLKTIWHSEAYHKFRQAILIGRKEIDICKNCTEGTKVWAD